VTIVIGEVDRGKTTLVAQLATALHTRGLRVGVLDADVGQSEIGPPLTVALGRVTRPLARTGDADVVALRFAGTTSVVHEQAGVVASMKALAARARAEGLERLIVDTSGLVRDLGQRIKRAKIDALAPDLLVAVQATDECEPILAAYAGTARTRAGADRPRIVRVTPSPLVRGRSPEVRRRYREDALAAHFAGARVVTLDLSRVALRRPSAAAGDPVVPPDGALVGLEDREGDLIALARVIGSDAGRGMLTVETPAAVARVAAVSVGRERAPR
jgi:polynucleotide 5'-hydroxyl-kinase GRC3/NOL9